MSRVIADTVPQIECDDRETLQTRQSQRLARLLSTIRGRSRFYTRKLEAAGIGAAPLRVPEDLARLPITTKAELVADQEAYPPWGTVLTEPLDRYTRYNQTSSTTGRPLRWPDTNESWQWMLDCWKAVYRAAHVGPTTGFCSRSPLVRSSVFGPHSMRRASWARSRCRPAACRASSGSRSWMRSSPPSFAARRHMRCASREVAAERKGADLCGRPACGCDRGRRAGREHPGNARTDRAEWGARVIDQHGLTEVGPVSFECAEAPGFLHLNENEFICEVLHPVTLAPVPDGEPGELVLTNLGRTASPVVRYRTGDVVIRRSERCACGRTFARLAGGILTRTDDMVNIRGVNVYPTAIEGIVRGFAEVAEFRVTITGSRWPRCASRSSPRRPPPVRRSDAARAVQDTLSFRADVRTVPRGPCPGSR